MLPSAKNYLIRGGYSPEAAAYILIGCFLAGVVGIQILSRFLHHYIPSHVVDCDHSHEGKDENESEADTSGETPSQVHDRRYSNEIAEGCEEDTPLLSRPEIHQKTNGVNRPRSATVEGIHRHESPFITAPTSRRPSLQTRLTSRVSTFVSGAKAFCDEGGPCYGYGDPCGKECFKAISRSPTRLLFRTSTNGSVRPGGPRRGSAHPLSHTLEPTMESLDEGPLTPSHYSHNHQTPQHLNWQVKRGRPECKRNFSGHSQTNSQSAANNDLESGNRKRGTSASSDANPPNDPSQAHHHHVPSNAFLSIGLQTSIAIALHKLPEGFITYATNHANPKLGFAVFIALFIHNITEGFAMALPLYLALGSRWKAMFWSSLLGGISQPLGAGVAALWFKLAGHTNMAPDERVYGGMFAITAGIMASVALQLFSESLGLTHNRNICIAFAFIGMGILGLSFALTAA